ncbi:uncharacterized protein LOC123721026 [Papilio machaon]|uniref:uncharacterized protein LOC123721026 n=1 Tax=Papilio machaon TaxID=76193 RepID=UPI001E662A41|nr:uncharacterized protein LOC123721026 [Papilio machaon]
MYYYSVYQILPDAGVCQPTRTTILRGFDCTAVLSDSRSSLDLVRNPDTRHPLATHIRQNIRELEGNGKTLRLFWVRAHVGVPGNERADELARLAAAQTKVAPAYDKCPLSYVKRRIREAVVKKWNDRYTNGATASVTKMFFPDIAGAHKIIKTLENKPAWAQILTGHGGFAAYLHKYKLKDDSACACDSAVPETVQHLLLECPMHDRDRCDLELRTGFKVNEKTISEIISRPDSRPHLERFCLSILKAAKKRNGSRIN